MIYLLESKCILIRQACRDSISGEKSAEAFGVVRSSQCRLTFFPFKQAFRVWEIIPRWKIKKLVFFFVA